MIVFNFVFQKFCDVRTRLLEAEAFTYAAGFGFSVEIKYTLRKKILYFTKNDSKVLTGHPKIAADFF